MADEAVGSMYGTTNLVTDTSVAVHGDASNDAHYSVNANDTRTKPDTLAEAQATDTQLRGMYDSTLQQIAQVQAQLTAKGINYTVQVPALASFDRGAIQEALNTAQANCNAAEGVLLVNDIAGGAIKLAETGALLGGASVAAKEGTHDAPLNPLASQPEQQQATVKSDNKLFAALLQGEKPVVSLAAENADRADLGGVKVAAGLPSIEHVHGLTGELSDLKYGNGRASENGGRGMFG